MPSAESTDRRRRSPAARNVIALNEIVVGYLVDTLAEGEMDEWTRESLTRVVRALQRMNAVIADAEDAVGGDG